MNLIKFDHQEDYGHDWYVRLVFTEKWALFQASVSWCDHPGWPFLQIKSGSGSLICIVFQTYKAGFTIGLLERTWKL